jgi:integrase
MTRHGRMVWYVRRNHGPRIRIKAEYGTPEFEAEYRAACDAAPAGRAFKSAGTLEWLWDRYRETTVWSQLAPHTRRQRENIMRPVLANSGAVLADRIERKHVVAGRDKRSATPAQAIHFLAAMSGLFNWAIDAGHVRTNPTLNIKRPSMPKTGGHPAWTEEDVACYEARWPIGTKERVWLAVLLYTGLRRSDAVVIGRQHVRNGVATLVTKKTKTTVIIPILPVLQDILNAGPTGDLVFICGQRRGPLTEGTFSHFFEKACTAAGVTKSAHGVRKISAIRLAHAGASVAELNAIMGWTGSDMALLYIQQADRARLAKTAMERLDGTSNEHSIPAPFPAPIKKAP